MSDELILRQASPTLAGLKTGSLFTVPYRSEAELRADVAEMNRRLAPKGVSLRVLRVRRRALLYLYRPRLSQPRLLAGRGGVAPPAVRLCGRKR